jgi:hypothetical protein
MEKKLYVRPKMAFYLAGMEETRLNPRKIYLAHPATNQPDYKKRGLIFVKDVLLGKEDYIIVKKKLRKVV